MVKLYLKVKMEHESQVNHTKTYNMPEKLLKMSINSHDKSVTKVDFS